MPVAKGQRVEVTSKGKVHLAHVLKVSASGVTLLLDTWGVSKPIDARHVKPSTAPVPEGAPGSRTWAKGDRIEFDYDGRLVHATVVSGDIQKLKAIADGGEAEHTLRADAAAPSTRVLPVPAPSAMDDWGVRSYKAVRAMSEETDAFTADVTYKGKKVLTAMNAGHGGCNAYHGAPDMVRKFHADAKAWFDESNIEHLVEPEDTWLNWEANLRPYAVDAREHLAKMEFELGCAIHTPPSL